MRVIVIGGGIAGLGAAWDLQAAGAEVTIIEKGSEIGGRCRSTRFAGQDIPLGAFAFPERDTALTRLASELGLRGSDTVQDLTAGHMLRLFWRNGRTDDVDSITPAHFMTLPFVPLREKLALTRLGLIMGRLAITGGYHAPENAAELDDISATDWFRRHAPVLYDKFLEPVSAMFCGYSDHEMSLAWMMWANARLVETHTDLPLARKWGDGEVASADGLRFVVPVRTVYSRPNSKYFGAGRGITY